MMLEIIKTNDGYMVQKDGEDYICDANGDNLWDTYAEAEAVFYGLPKTPKKVYKVTASLTTYFFEHVEASSEDEAYAMAKAMDGGSFIPVDQGIVGEWSIDSVSEVSE